MHHAGRGTPRRNFAATGPVAVRDFDQEARLPTPHQQPAGQAVPRVRPLGAQCCVKMTVAASCMFDCSAYISACRFSRDRQSALRGILLTIPDHLCRFGGERDLLPDIREAGRCQPAAMPRHHASAGFCGKPATGQPCAHASRGNTQIRGVFRKDGGPRTAR